MALYSCCNPVKDTQSLDSLHAKYYGILKNRTKGEACRMPVGPFGLIYSQARSIYAIMIGFLARSSGFALGQPVLSSDSKDCDVKMQ